MRRVVASHQAHYWFTAKQLLASMAPGAPEIRGVRRKLELAQRLRAVLLPGHPDAAAAASTSVGQIGYANAIELLALMLELDDIPPTPFSATMSAVAVGRLEKDGVDATALHGKLSDMASAELDAHAYVWRWER